MREGETKVISQKEIMKLDCGIRFANFFTTYKYYPALRMPLATLACFDEPQDFVYCIKVHMLMPGQWPCIPNWHLDFVPRKNGQKIVSKITPEHPMYLWCSNAPLTEFKDGRAVEPGEWVKFNQLDLHRGVASSEHIWRVFIRATHKELVKDKKCFKPRHSQVYLDSNNFEW